jgi:hypothetical protein
MKSFEEGSSLSPAGPGRRSGSGSGEAARPASRRLSSSVLLALLLLGTGAGMREAFGQDSGATPLASSNPDPVSVDLAPPQAGSQSQADLTPDQMLARAQQFVAGIEQSSSSISRQLQAARKDRDVVRVLCLNDKLNQVDVASGSARDRLASLRTAVSRSDADRSRHEFTVLEVLNDRVRVLVNESNQCVGEETGFIGEAEVSVSVDPSLPNADTSFVSITSQPLPPFEISSPTQ